MKKNILFLIFLLIVTYTFGSECKSSQTMSNPDTTTIVQSFYYAYCSNWKDSVKVDSILSKYCTKKLKDFLLNTESIDGYDFVTDGDTDYEVIAANPISVIKDKERYKVTFKTTKYPSEELSTVILYILVNQEGKISHITRSEDNLTVPK